MRKILLMFILITSLFGFTSCSLSRKYKDEAGVYKLYYMTGDLQVNMYDFYTITLEANGKCLVESKGIYSPQVYSAPATFKIEDEKIYIETKAGNSTITEVYGYIDGEIHMYTQTIQGVTFSARFKR